MNDEAVRALFDTDGRYVGANLKHTHRFLCFAQIPTDRTAFDVTSWDICSTKWFKTRLGIYIPKLGEGGAKARPDAARILIKLHNETSASRWCTAEATTEEMLALAERAETLGGLAGLAALAKRCATVFTLEASDAKDPFAITLAATLATLYSGPVLPPGDACVVGTKTLRSWL
jgi:hypothetical protein